MRKVVALVFMITFACAHRDGPFRQVAGQHFDHSRVGNIIDGRTTEDDVVGWFGPPVEVRQLAGQARQFEYFSRRQRESIEGLLFWKKKHVQIWDQRLTLTVADKVVQEHHYISNGGDR